MPDTTTISTGESQKLEKAYLSIVAASSHGVSPHSGKTITFTYNPTHYTVTKTAIWARTVAAGAHSAGPLQWRGAGPSVLSLQLFLDRSDTQNGSVHDDAQALLDCCVPTSDSLRANKPSAPYVLFGWGTTTTFTAAVREVSVQYLLFRPNGTPYRASVWLVLEEVDIPTARQNPTSGGLVSSRTAVVVEGDTLALIAHREYGDPSRWRQLADLNGIDDPLRLPVGMRLLLPGDPLLQAKQEEADDHAALLLPAAPSRLALMS